MARVGVERPGAVCLLAQPLTKTGTLAFFVCFFRGCNMLCPIKMCVQLVMLYVKLHSSRYTIHVETVFFVALDLMGSFTCLHV